MFEALGFTKEDAHNRFGFLLDAFKYVSTGPGACVIRQDASLTFGKAMTSRILSSPVTT